jgi:hypothetical protein
MMVQGFLSVRDLLEYARMCKGLIEVGERPKRRSAPVMVSGRKFKVHNPSVQVDAQNPSGSS